MKSKNAGRKKFHYIYKTTCLITGKYYIGMHSTDDLNDGYKGSGKYLRNSLNKYGEENHVVEILEHLPDRKSLILREEEIVTKEIIDDKMCMNIRVGGTGGFEHVPIEIQNVGRSKGGLATKELWSNNEFVLKMNSIFRSDKFRSTISKAVKQKYENGYENPFTGKSHSKTSIQKMSEAKKDTCLGSSNSQFGTCWVCLDKPIKIKKAELDSYLKHGYRRGRKCLQD